MKKYENKKFNRFYIIFILAITALVACALHKIQAEHCANAGLENALYSFIEKIKENRDARKKKYEECNYDKQCEIWVIPKTTIDKLADDVTYVINSSEPSFIIDTAGEAAQIMEFDIDRFMRIMNGERLKDFSINDFNTKSIVYEFGSELQLYNQENFMLKENKLFMKKIYLGPLHSGYRYRFGDKVTPGDDNVTRVYPLDQCKNVISFMTFDTLFGE
ncbi:hypothetical protein BKK54_11170 [Rodentibacter genomosp. 1]|uniref:Uncharacterized protein n=1 Tax=Rodentibacter genomosp. 1 TaxID=1908264 RepID=A0A1V3J029_9PAST|nr:hypothetical protein [Rodentibacter genomosp. 1]OOF48104.1 hypothetical protein BKK54_11170 [Rodentibacter genomosp. 1]